MAKLAINGGRAVRNAKRNPWPKWPVWSAAESKRLAEVLDSGVWSYNGPREQMFNAAYASFVGSQYALCAANGTVTLQLALEALDIGYGDEVIVPGLTWQATAAAVIDVNAAPVLVDVDPDTWCIDVKAAAAAVTRRTRAIIPVHLYGCISDMDAVMKLARKHQLAVVEDCAHQHGSQWKGRGVGSIGDIGSFSFQLSKVLTAGEGGALTTSNRALWERLDALRNCGRRPRADVAKGGKGAGQYGSEGDFIQSGNYRITEFQAAVLLEQLKRVLAQVRLRDRNAIHLNGLLAQIPGIRPMKRDPRTTRQSYFNFAFRYDPKEFKGLPVERFRAALQAETGFEVEHCYVPLNDCALYRPLTKKRYHLSREHWKAIDARRFKLPVCERAHFQESVCCHHSVLMAGKKDMGEIAEAVEKIRANADELLKR
ncbi:MAG TPA: DegT/DnrJ/EryC1/StrS family aminotransferase [bacterium]|nr:DegT/DnrJ/EryC1/StrS family aminotransferase [bacterium]